MLTQERLKELLKYNPETGIFTWKCTRGGSAKKGCVAGHIDTQSGYRRIEVEDTLYRASRLAFLIVEGYFPEHYVDHINRVKSDDRWLNLRHVSAQCNTINRGVPKNNKTGVTGVFFDNAKKKWIAYISKSRKRYHLGDFTSFSDAVRTRFEAEVRFKFQDCNSTSSAFLYLKEVQPRHSLYKGGTK
jgi:hypothetical protein